MAAVCAAAMLPVPCRAQETYTYTLLEDGTISLICEDKAITNAEIPSELDGYTVTELAEGCFSDCTGLETVTIPDTITTIQSYVFQNCTKLREVTIPASVTMIDEFVFEGCVDLTEIRVDKENTAYYDTDGVLFSRGLSGTLMRYPASRIGESYIVPSTCKTLSPWSFTDCQNLETINLSNVNAIGADAFLGASKLQSVEIPDGVRELIGAAFANCKELKSVKLPPKLESIGDRCFFGCISLTEITLPSSLKSIGEMAFYGCVWLTEMEIPSSVETIGEYGIGYSVDSNGDPAKIYGMKLEVDFGSEGYRYAKKNDIAFHAEISQAIVILILVGVIMVMLLLIGVSVEMNKRKQAKLAEEARRREQRRAERSARKKRRK